MSEEFREFIFEGFDFDESRKSAEFRYSLDGKIEFCERFFFDFEVNTNFDRSALNRAIFGLFLMAGISYFKTFCPARMRFREKWEFLPEQRAFFQKIYRHGLGEFFVQNGMNPERKINFPTATEGNAKVREAGLGAGCLVAIGGGKDSICTAEILGAGGVDFANFVVCHSEKSAEIPLACAAKNGRKICKIHREISGNLQNLNKSGAKNGHVPISAILSFAGAVAGILTGRGNVIFSNEHSANEPTVGKVNHQYSKTVEFERDFQEYCRKFVATDLRYFSFLRPLCELKIAEIFCGNFLEKYDGNFSSCNRNFKIRENSAKIGSWCGECPKCAFVFLIFSPFLERERILKLFGKNLFADAVLEPVFREILGLADSKPWECVGEIAEAREAAREAERNFPELRKFTKFFPVEKFDREKLHPHAMPEEFFEILRSAKFKFSRRGAGSD